MAVFIASNTISSVRKRLAVDQAIRDAIGEREGAWRVSIAEAPNKSAWNVIVRSPAGFYWAHHFEGRQCTTSELKTVVRESLEKAEEAAAVDKAAAAEKKPGS
jgi:hypothetical protein